MTLLDVSTKKPGQAAAQTGSIYVYGFACGLWGGTGLLPQPRETLQHVQPTAGGQRHSQTRISNAEWTACQGLVGSL